MPATTRVTDYVLAAMKTAIYEDDGEGTISASIPLFPGILAFGDDRVECEGDLTARVTDWVGTAYEEGYRLPVVDGIDLNAEKGRGAPPRRRGSAETSRDEFYPSEDELEAAFARVDAEIGE